MVSLSVNITSSVLSSCISWEQGLKLMDDDNIPVLPKFGAEMNHSAEIQAFIDQMETE